MDAVRKDVGSLVQKELDSANKKFPLFRSAHEGYAVILEEFEEAESELDSVKISLGDLWTSVKANDCSSMVFAESVNKYALNLAVEAIQVAAMAQKFMNSLDGGMDDADI